MKTCFNNDLGKQLTIENSNIVIYLTATLGVVENKPAWQPAMTTCSNLSHVKQKETYSISVSYDYVQTCRVNFCDNENRRTNWRRWNVLKSNRLKKFNRVYINDQKNYKDDLIVLSKNTAYAK